MIEFLTASNVAQMQQDLPYLIETMEWVRNFLGLPHPDLGRSGLGKPFCAKRPKAKHYPNKSYSGFTFGAETS